MKRFVETDRWKDPWFRGLSTHAKLAFQYICDCADNAGVWDADYQLANFCIKADINWLEVMEEFGDRVKEICDGRKVWITRFVRFQCGELTPACPPHRKVIELLKKNGIDLNDPWITGEKVNGVNGHAHEGINGNAIKSEVKPMELPGMERTTKPKTDRARDFAFEAMALVCGRTISRITGIERGKMNNALKEIRRVEPEVSAERIKLAARNWKAKYPNAPVTEMTLAGHWSELTPELSSEQAQADRQKLRATIKENEEKLASFMTPGRDFMIFKDDLTAEQMKEAAHLQTMIAAQKKAL